MTYPIWQRLNRARVQAENLPKAETPQSTAAPTRHGVSLLLAALKPPQNHQRTFPTMAATDPRYSFTYVGGVTADAQVIAALGSQGVMTVEPDSLVASMMPDAFDDDGNGKKIVSQCDMGYLMLGGLTLDTTVGANGTAFAVKGARYSSALKDLKESVTSARHTYRPHPARAASRPQAARPPTSRHAPPCARRSRRAVQPAPHRPARAVVLEQDEFCALDAAIARDARPVGVIHMRLRMRAHV